MEFLDRYFHENTLYKISQISVLLEPRWSTWTDKLTDMAEPIGNFSHCGDVPDKNEISR